MIDLVFFSFLHVDEDECSLGKHNCVGLTKCQNEIGSFKCVCKSGYERKGTNCSGAKSKIIIFLTIVRVRITPREEI